MNRLFVLHFAVTLYMTGVIWVVQVLHYPLLSGENQSFHMSRITYLVGGPMLIEAATGACLFWEFRSDRVWQAASLALLLIWVSTFALQVPAHNRLGEAWNAPDHGRLVAGNWIRTVLWTSRAALLCLVADRIWRTR